MTVNIRQLSVGLAPAVKLGDATPGSTVIISVNDTAADIAWGTNSGVTASTGSLVQPSGPTVFTVPENASTFEIWAVSGTGSHATSLVVIGPG